MTAPVDPRTVVHMNTQLWSTQVGMVDGCDRAEPVVVYEFAGGKRKFVDKRDPYQPLEPR